MNARYGPALLLFASLLVAGNWYLQPGRLRTWSAALLVLLCLSLVLRFATRRPFDSAARRYAAFHVRTGVACAALMMAASLLTRLARALGAVDDPDLGRRLAMVFLGAFFVLSGNAMPKMLAPLSEPQCDRVRQSIQRFIGWAWVLTGLTIVVAWLGLPPRVAEPLSVASIVAGALAVALHVSRLRRTRKEA